MAQGIASEVWETILSRCWRRDDDFRREFLENPNAVIERVFKEVTGEEFKIPDGVTFNVIQETPGMIHFIIPLNPYSEASGEKEEAALKNYLITKLRLSCSSYTHEFMRRESE